MINLNTAIFAIITKYLILQCDTTHIHTWYNNGTLDSIQVQWKECDYYTGSTNTQVHWNSSGSCGKMSSCTKHELEKKKGNKYTWSLLHHYYYIYS